MGVWDSLLHPRAQHGRFTGTGGLKHFSPQGGQSAPSSGGGKGGKGKGGGKGKKSGKAKVAKGPSRSELAMVGQVMAGNILTTDGGKTWSVLGSKTPGTATAAMRKAQKDQLVSPPGKGSNRPTPTQLGLADFKKAGLAQPVAKAPLIARAAAAKQQRAVRAQQVATRAAARRAVAQQRSQARTAAAVRKASQPQPIRGTRGTTTRLGGVRQTVSRRNRFR